MPLQDSAARRLDPVAVQAALRRLARNPHLPWLHAEVARRMADRLSWIRMRPELVIDWWSTLGQGAPWLVKAYPGARQVRVEPGVQWLQRARELARRPGWPSWLGRSSQALCLDEADRLPAEAGLIWSNMMLHAVVDPVALIGRWHAALRVDGFVMFSCLGPGTLRELRTLYASLGWPPPTPGFIDMHDLGDMLVQTGFADPVMDQETLTLRWPTASALLAELRTLGGNAAPDRHRGLHSPAWRARLEHAIGTLAMPDGSIGLSFEVAYGHAFKAPPRPRVAGSTAVSLDDMRSMIRTRRPRATGTGVLR